MTKSKLILALGAMLCLAVTPSAFAANTAKVETTGSSTIKGLNIAAKTGKVESFADDSGYHAEAYIAGTYTAPSAQWVLSAGDQSVTWRGTKGTGGFYYKAPLTGKTTVIDFTAVTPSGDLQHQSVQITFDDYDTAKEEALAHPADSGKFLVGAQVQSISYQDARSPNISEVAINITADYHRSIINPDWFVDAFGSASALPLGSGGNDLRFYKVDLQIGHDFNLSDSTQLGLSVGGSYEAMTESTANLGFSPLFGPEVVLLAKMRALTIASPLASAIRFLATPSTRSRSIWTARPCT
jgi:hypothetical protein